MSLDEANKFTYDTFVRYYVHCPRLGREGFATHVYQDCFPLQENKSSLEHSIASALRKKGCETHKDIFTIARARSGTKALEYGWSLNGLALTITELKLTNNSHK
jgi:hypothetical protein